MLSLSHQHRRWMMGNGKEDNEDVISDAPEDQDVVMTTESEQEEPFSPLLSFPLEILYNIIEYVYVDNDISSINSNLEKLPIQSHCC